jgi:arsenate reductase
MRQILFLSQRNSTQSQIAEALLNRLGYGQFIAESAGVLPGELNPLAITVMQEIGIDIRHQKSKMVRSLYNDYSRFDTVVKIIGQSHAMKYPDFPGVRTTLEWKVDDPSYQTASYEEALANTRRIRDEIREKVQALIAAPIAPGNADPYIFTPYLIDDDYSIPHVEDDEYTIPFHADEVYAATYHAHELFIDEYIAVEMY